MLLTGCQSSAQQDTQPEIDNASSDQPAPTQPEQNGTEQEETPTITSPTPPLEDPSETLGPDCYGDETHPIGQSIADLYPELTEYDEVMVWFCNGFEFEDILTALQTSEQTGIPAGDLLDIFTQGPTWEDIWVELGLLEP